MSESTPTLGRTAVDRGKQSLRLWLRLLTCENIIEQRIRGRLRTEFGVTLPQFDVMAALEHINEPLTMTELSNRLMVSNGNVTGVVDRLVREGYVRRVPSRRDRRVQLIQLTARGIDIFGRIASRHEQWVSESFAEFPLEDVRRLTALLSRAHEQLRDNGGGENDRQ